MVSVVAAAAVAKFPHKMVGSKVKGLRQDTKVWSQGLVGQNMLLSQLCGYSNKVGAMSSTFR